MPSTGQTFIVDDPGNPTPTTGTLTLAQAISDVDADTGTGARDTIKFNIPGSANQVQTISIAGASPLPAVTQPVLIDGWSEGNFENSTTGYTGPPLIVLHGDDGGASIDGLQFSGSSAGSTVQGLVINNFSGDGIALSTSGNLIQGDYLGTDAQGTAGRPNSGDGVSISAAANTIGGTASGAANVISGNSQFGVYLGGSGTSGNLVLGNLIGPGVHGTASLGLSDDGVVIASGAAANTIGGTASGAANVITSSSDVYIGVHLDGSGTSGNVVLGNMIGVDANGTAKVGSLTDGVYISNATANTIGGLTSGAGNVISGNVRDGVQMFGAGASGNVVLGNLIGTDVHGTASLGNGIDGVSNVNGATANTIGGTASGAANVISGNSRNGVTLYGSGTSGNVVLGNLIGTDVHGTASLGNGYNGVAIVFGGTANTIGGTASGAANVISGNGRYGVYLFGAGTSGNVVLGNLIGTDVSGTAKLGNGVDGVDITNGATGNTIGGTAAGAANVISGNNFYGVWLSGAGTSGNVVLGKLIGTDVHGTASLGNGYNGVAIVFGGTANTIGGTASGAANVISGNGRYGVYLFGAGTSGNVVLGNLIGTDVHGTASLGNGIDGVAIEFGATANTIGGTASGAANVISGNSRYGVWLSGAGTSGNVVLGNLIGTDVHGTASLGNGIDGVAIEFGATANTIGGTASGAANVISGNSRYGVTLYGSGTSGNVVLGNLIGTDVHGTASLGNGIDGVAIFDGPTANTIGGTASGAANVISGNSRYGVYLFGAGTSGNVVLGNLIGTDVHGTASLGNGIDGVSNVNSATANTIGGTASGAANVISGNSRFGVYLYGSGTSGNLVLGNLIGTQSNGTAKLGNAGAGVRIQSGATLNTIGGTASGAGNVISGNAGNGVTLYGSGTSGNLVLGNKIGVDKNATINLGNVGAGVSLLGGASHNTIGGTTSGAGNTIARNPEGVVLNGATTIGDSILGNSIFANTGLGIDLGNPAGNHGQKAPVTTALTSTSYSATLTSANGTYRVEVFATPTAGSLFQGKTFLGATNVVITSGSAAFSLTGLAIPASSYVTATATNLGTFDTSVFSGVATTTKVTSSPTIKHSNAQQTIKLTAQVSSTQTVAVGSVTFTVVGLGSVTVNVNSKGKAKVNFVVPAGTAAGSYQIIAFYNGDDNFAPSSSDPLEDGVLTVKKK